MHYSYGHKSLKSKKSRNQKNSETKKNHHSPTVDSNSRSKNEGQLDQVLGRSSKKDSCSNRGSQGGQSFNTPAISSNATVVKKDKKQGDKDPSQVECYLYLKKGHYFNKCPDNELKN